MILKIIKKTLLFMIMTAIVMTTPGVAGAIPIEGVGQTLEDSGQNTELGKKRDRAEDDDDEQEDQQAEKRLKVKEGDLSGEKNYINVVQDKKESFEKKDALGADLQENDDKAAPLQKSVDVVEKIIRYRDRLAKEKDYCYVALKTLIQIGQSARCGLFNGCSNEQKQKIVDMLTDWSKSDDFKIKANVVAAIGDLAKNGFFDDCPDELKMWPVEILINHIWDDSSEDLADACWGIEMFVKHNLLNGQLDCQVPRIIDFLTSPKNALKCRPYVASLIGYMAKQGLLKDCSNEQNLQLIDIIIDCAEYFKKYRESTFAIGLLAKADLLKDCSNEQKRRIMDFLADGFNCGESVRLNVLTAIANMAKAGFFSENLASEALKLVDMMNGQVNGDGCKKYFVQVIGNLAGAGVLNGCSQSKKQHLLKTLLGFIDNDDDCKKYFVRAIGDLIRAGFLDGYGFSEVFELIDRLTGLADGDDSKKYITIAIENLADAGFLNGCNSSQSQHLIKTLSECASSDDPKKYVAKTIGHLAKASFLNGCCDDQKQQLTNVLVGCCSSGRARKYVANSIKNLAENDFFAGCCGERILQIAKALSGCTADEDAKKHVKLAVLSLDAKGLLGGFSDEQKKRILKGEF